MGKWQEAQSRNQLYTELMSKREQADTDLRREMFTSIMDNFLKPPAQAGAPGAPEALDSDVLKMELLAENFHDSFNLTPLFKELERRLDQRIHDGPDAAVSRTYLNRLRILAEDVTTKQLAVLESADNTLEFTVDMSTPPGDPSLSKTQAMTVDKIQREITVTVTAIDGQTQELRMSLHVRTLNGAADVVLTPDDLVETDREFWVGSFDFPMIDNTRLSRDQRCAITVEFYPQQATTVAKITAVCFPGSRTTFKEKPFYDEVLEQLQPTGTL